MATTSYKSFLMYKASGEANYTKLVDIKDYPNLGGTPEMLDKTTLSEGARSYLLGIQETEAMEFTLNYDPDEYDTIKALEGVEKDFAVWFGGTESAGTVTPTGSDGKFNFKGYISVYVSGKGVNEVREMMVTIAPTTVITKGEAN